MPTPNPPATQLTTLADIMTGHVVTIDIDATLAQVEAAFSRYRFHHIVATENGKPVGIISDRDLLAARSPYVGTMSEQQRDTATLQRRVHQIMSRRLRTGSPSMSAADAALVLVQHSIGALPVLDACGSLVGIVTWRDLLRWAVRDLAPPVPACPAKGACRSCGGCDEKAAA
jgi:acetoin utilization protein AcuB